MDSISVAASNPPPPISPVHPSKLAASHLPSKIANCSLHCVAPGLIRKNIEHDGEDKDCGK